MVVNQEAVTLKSPDEPIVELLERMREFALKYPDVVEKFMSAFKRRRRKHGFQECRLGVKAAAAVITSVYWWEPLPSSILLAKALVQCEEEKHTKVAEEYVEMAKNALVEFAKTRPFNITAIFEHQIHSGLDWDTFLVALHLEYISQREDF